MNAYYVLMSGGKQSIYIDKAVDGYDAKRQAEQIAIGEGCDRGECSAIAVNWLYTT